MSKPIQPEQVYKITAKRLNLSEDYVKDAIEFFYDYNKSRMFTLSYVVFYLSGLGRFIIKPLSFYSKKKKLKQLVDKFNHRRDDRGIVIKNELNKRLQYFEDITFDVNNLNEYIRKRMYKKLRNENDLEK